MAKRGPHRTATQREADLAEIARLDRLGFTQRAIAERVGVDHSMVCLELQALRQRYRDTQLEERGAQVVEMLEGYRDLMAEAAEGWERSKEDAERVVVQEIPGGRCGRCKGRGKTAAGADCNACEGEGKKPARKITTRTTQGQAGDPQFLRIMVDVRQAIRDLCGLDEAKTTNLRQVSLSWDDLYKNLPPADAVEQELARLMPKPPEPPAEPGQANGTNGTH